VLLVEPYRLDALRAITGLRPFLNRILTTFLRPAVTPLLHIDIHRSRMQSRSQVDQEGIRIMEIIALLAIGTLIALTIGLVAACNILREER